MNKNILIFITIISLIIFWILTKTIVLSTLKVNATTNNVSKETSLIYESNDIEEYDLNKTLNDYIIDNWIEKI